MKRCLLLLLVTLTVNDGFSKEFKVDLSNQQILDLKKGLTHLSPEITEDIKSFMNGQVKKRSDDDLIATAALAVAAVAVAAAVVATPAEKCFDTSCKNEFVAEVDFDIY